MSILIKGIPLGGYEISIMKDGERYRARVDGIWCEVEEIPTTEPDTDTISRKAAIEALRAMQTYKLFAGDDMLLIDQAGAQTELMMLPPAQPAPSQVAADIARIVENGKDMRVIEAAQPTPDQNGDLWITVPDIDKVTCIYVQESKSKFCRIFYEER